MKGYTIQHSIDLLEDQVEDLQNTPGGGSTAADITYDNTSSHMTADDVQEAIDELNTAIGQIDTGIHYSETERKVGTWLDGSDLFEKTVTGTTAATSDVTIIAELDSDCVIRKFDGLVGGVREINSLIDNLSSSITWISGTDPNKLANISTGSIYQSKAYFARLLYTKTPAPETNTRSKKSKKEE